MTNEERAKKVKKLLGLEENKFNDENRYISVADVICDLRHFCDLNSIDWMEEQIRADNYYVMEGEN